MLEMGSSTLWTEKRTYFACVMVLLPQRARSRTTDYAGRRGRFPGRIRGIRFLALARVGITFLRNCRRMRPWWSASHKINLDRSAGSLAAFVGEPLRRRGPVAASQCDGTGRHTFPRRRDIERGVRL